MVSDLGTEDDPFYRIQCGASGEIPIGSAFTRALGTIA